MRFKLLGKSGLRVSELCLGTMTFGEEWGWGANKDESRRIFDAFAESGGNFLDTANIYTAGTSEKLVGEFIGNERERFVLATKYTSNMRPGDPNAGGNHRKNFFQALEASLKRLNTPYIDLYWLHAWDFTTPVDEVMRAFDDAVRAGKILYAGISDAPAWIVSQANTMAKLKGWTPFVGLQIEYSLIERTPERDLLPMAQALGLGVTPWSPLGSGLLSGKYGKDTPAEQRRLDKTQFTPLTERNLAIAEEVKAVAAEVGRSPSQVALAWVRQRYNSIPILGARTMAQIKDNLGCLEFILGEQQMGRLNEVSKIDLGFPHEFLARDAIRQIIFGGTFDKIDPHPQ
ncbi:MAG TPA: aldo/keto reductase [Tepidisphaeraceae bacterium]|nr:aldo/keto reductase [Tepidisphaeraceae bacterium]